jgi:hypothetical protein
MSFKTIYQTVGNAVAQWEEDSPLRWTMREPARKGGLILDPIECDLTMLTSGYSEAFLLALKDVLIASRHRVQLRTIESQSRQLRLLLERVYARGYDSKTNVSRIDVGFVVALHALADDVPADYLRLLRHLHQSHRDDARLFESGLRPSDFPIGHSKRGQMGDRIHRILAHALRRSTLVHVLDICEAAFEDKQLDIGRYVFTRLALNIFCRPETYRRLTLADLRVDKDPQTGALNHFLDASPAKSRVHNPSKIAYRLHPEVGKLLEMQRKAVVERFGHLAPTEVGGPELGRLALFPALRLQADGSAWFSAYANAHNGMLNTSGFLATYLKPIQSLTGTPLSCNALRHTIGTQLAQMGCSSHTIQAVLKHASDAACRAYVDIVFEGLIDELSDGLKPGFDEHFPVISMFASKADAMPLERRIVSDDLETGRVETTAICGRQVACSYAPIACYACPRFVPCHDADHTINLDVVDREIKASEGRGLAMQHDVQRWKTIRNNIRLVIAVCGHKRMALESEAAAQTGVPE